TCALPNLIVDYPIVPEYFNRMIRSEALVRWIERLANDTLQRQTMLDGFDALRDYMKTNLPAGQMAAEKIFKYLETRKHS
ncbi:lipid-A-disaccharide synthase, partial [Liberibacter sp. Z1]|nr:lipid-A-disaccharide synthase [Candidatus Liberibacter sp.]